MKAHASSSRQAATGPSHRASAVCTRSARAWKHEKTEHDAIEEPLWPTAGVIYHEAWCGCGAAWGDVHVCKSTRGSSAWGDVRVAVAEPSRPTAGIQP
jgi:hypothetical protein